jgi:hypothetical protein
MLAVMAMVPLDLEFGGLVFSRLFLGLNFLFSGVAVGALALYFLRRRWLIPARQAWMIAGICGSPDEPGVGDISDAVPRRAIGREFCCLFDNTFRSLTASPSHCRS